jgi:hypothetical protein
MLGSSIQGLGNSGYGLLYVVPATFVYLLITNTPIQLYYVGWEIPEVLLYALTTLSIYSAIWLHQASLMIFGDNAGMKSSKTQSVINKHFCYFAFGVPPTELPDDSSLLAVVLSAIRSGNVRWGVFLRFLPVGFTWVYTVSAWLLLTNSSLASGATLVGGAFWLTLTIILVRNVITGYLPHHIPKESLDGVDEAEYARNRRLATSIAKDDPKPRIQDSKSDNQTKIR